MSETQSTIVPPKRQRQKRKSTKEPSEIVPQENSKISEEPVPPVVEEKEKEPELKKQKTEEAIAEFKNAKLTGEEEMFLDKKVEGRALSVKEFIESKIENLLKFMEKEIPLYRDNPSVKRAIHSSLADLPRLVFHCKQNEDVFIRNPIGASNSLLMSIGIGPVDLSEAVTKRLRRYMLCFMEVCSDNPEKFENVEV
jgi:hypothetical protein